MSQVHAPGFNHLLKTKHFERSSSEREKKVRPAAPIERP